MFAAMTRVVRGASETVKAPLGFVLEGGYALGPLARSVVATLEVLIAPSPSEQDGKVSLAPAAQQARERLARWWPALSGG